MERGVLWGDELLLPHPDALSAIQIASENQIAILGVDVHRVRQGGLETVLLFDPSRSISFAGDWTSYVAAINAESARWTREHPPDEGHLYLLSSTSFDEFSNLKAK
jgi:hypothetical protein